MSDPVYSSRSWADSPTEASTLELKAGALVADKYRLLRPAGFGGMGAVWVARNEATGAEVAVKILLAHKAETPEVAARFRREAYAAAQLAHRGIVRVFDLVELGPPHEGSLVMVMELLRGGTLADLMDKQPRFTVQETLDIVMPLLSALAHAHRAGVIHRDLKPENVFLAVDPDGHVTPKILDFGISKLTSVEVPSITTDGAMLGTPSYMSPEQVRGAANLDARSDVFTMGILVYEMLAGKNPFQNPTYHSVVAAILERDPEPLPDVGTEVWAVIARALRKRPEDRFNNASELAVALRKAALAQGATLNYDPERSAPPMQLAQVAAAQSAMPSSPGVPPSVPGLEAEPAILLKRGRASDATELSLRVVERRVETRSRFRFGLGVGAAAVAVLLLAGVVWKVTRRASVSPTSAAGAAETASTAATAATAADAAIIPANSTAATNNPILASPTNGTVNVPATVAVATPASVATVSGASGTGVPSGRASPKPPAVAKPPPTTRASTASVAATAKPGPKPNGVIKDPGF